MPAAASPAPSRAAATLRPAPAPGPGLAPSWAAAALGSRLWDSHDRRHLDMSGGRGAVVLGHADPEVEAAAAAPGPEREREARDRLLAQLCVGRVVFTAHADDALALAVAVARRATGRAEVVRPVDHEALRLLPSRLAQGDVAGVVAHPDVLAGGMAHAVRGLTAASGAVLILDETATGLRRGAGGAQAALGIRADMSVWGAGLANGRPIGAVTGDAVLLRHAAQAPPADAASVAAAAATLRKLERENVALHLAVRGAEIQAELEMRSAEAGLAERLRVGGDPSWIVLEVTGPDATRARRRFEAQLMARAVYAPGPLAVGHRHDDAEVDELLDAVAAALPVLARAEAVAA